jgi:hypothetical protein
MEKHLSAVFIGTHWHFRTPPLCSFRVRYRPLGEDQEQQIRLRAIAQIAKLSRELEKNERARTDLYNAGVMQTKTEQLDDAGLKTLFLRG